MEKKTKFSIWYVILAFWGLLLIQNFYIQAFQTEEIPYSDFLADLDNGKIAEVTILSNRIEGKYQGEAPDRGKQRIFRTIRVNDPDLVKKLIEKNVKFTGVIESTFVRDLLSWVVPIFLFAGIWFFMMRRMGSQQGFLSLGKNKAKIYAEEDTKIGFDDVAGLDEAKTELQEIVDFLKYPGRYTSIGGKMPRGVLLVGPPGTGKTLMARAVAGEGGVPFFIMSGSEFVELFVGMGAAKVRDLFEQAKAKQPCIIFIDELDALGKARGGMSVGGHDEREQTLNQLLVEMDGFDPSSAIVLMAATNRPEILDPALLRPGRFDRQVLIDKPDKVGRVEILKVHLKGVHVSDRIDLEEIAGMTPGFAGADLANLVNEAALLAVRRGKDEVTQDEFHEAVERVVAGLEKKNRLINPHEREIVAYHETGHALVGLSLPGSDPVQKITIIPRGISALGYTLNVPTEERFLMTKAELENKITMMLGGQAAEEVVFGEISTGAHNDLLKATDIARGMVMEYGMYEGLGRVYLENERRAHYMNVPGMESPRKYSEETAREVDIAIRRILEEQFDRAKSMLSERMAVMKEGAMLLMQKEKIQGKDLEEILVRHGFTIPKSESRCVTCEEDPQDAGKKRITDGDDL